jgi:hypothetical protein
LKIFCRLINDAMTSVFEIRVEKMMSPSECRNATPIGVSRERSRSISHWRMSDVMRESGVIGLGIFCLLDVDNFGRTEQSIRCHPDKTRTK